MHATRLLLTDALHLALQARAGVVGGCLQPLQLDETARRHLQRFQLDHRRIQTRLVGRLQPLLLLRTRGAQLLQLLQGEQLPQ